jgi:hypothetical protein
LSWGLDRDQRVLRLVVNREEGFLCNNNFLIGKRGDLKKNL